MNLRLDVVLEGDEFIFGATPAEAKVILAAYLHLAAERLERSNDPSPSAIIVDDATGETIGSFNLRIMGIKL